MTPSQSALRLALLGNPNCGKTALFNLLTGARQKVANYAGVTVERKEGWLSTARFIPVAESSGVIGALGLWVLREACAQGRRWRDQGLPEMTIAVNVSLHQF